MINISSEIKVIPLTGNDVEPFIPELARLRIEVFRDYPYLYEGSQSYEESYLKTYLKSPDTIFVLARYGSTVVGASSGMPLSLETTEVKQPFIEKQIPVKDVFYFGESVLLSNYRGFGIGKLFFKERESHASSKGFQITAFCGVARPENHPLRPADYRPLDSFWEKQGYRRQDDMITHFEWPDINQTESTPKKMVFWLKQL